jgi:protoporphyrinogen/coproporphyrinogen III oxidase
MNTQATESYSTKHRATRHVIIIGGGITGLSAAWTLQKAGIPYILLEKSARWGGKVCTEQVEIDGVGIFTLEVGADALLTRKPWALALARELGLNDRIEGVKHYPVGTFVLHQGQPVPLPEGLSLLVPTKLKPFLQSPLFSLWGKFRMLLEPLIPARKQPGDESLAQFVRRRFGAEALDKLAEPLLCGIYNASPHTQSIQATFPQFPAMEQQHGSLIRGTRAAQKIAPTSAEAAPAFISFKNGINELVDALAARLKGDLRLNTGVHSIEALPDDCFRVILDSGETLDTDGVIACTPANHTAAMLSAAPQAAQYLSAIRYSSIGAVSVGYRREDVPHPLNGLGVVIPSSENRRIDGITWTSSKWDHRAPENHVLLRVFFGGPHTQDMMQHDDNTVFTVVQNELQSILGIDAPPLFYRVHRWQNAYPQYELGHLERIAQLEAALPPGITIAGSSYRGIGVPDCIRQGQQAAQQAVAKLGAVV